MKPAKSLNLASFYTIWCSLLMAVELLILFGWLSSIRYQRSGDEETKLGTGGCLEIMRTQCCIQPIFLNFLYLNFFQSSPPFKGVLQTRTFRWCHVWKKKKKKDVKRKNLFQLFPGCFNEEPARKEGTGSSSALRPENRAAESGGYFLLWAKLSQIITCRRLNKTSFFGKSSDVFRWISCCT